MKQILFLLTILLTICGYTQNKISGKYKYYTYTLDLYEDSTFHIEYNFDLIIDIGHGHYLVNNDTIILKYVHLFDTIYYSDTNRGMIIGSDEKNTVIQKDNSKRELLLVQNDKSDILSRNIDFDDICCAIGTNNSRFPKKLYCKSKKLFFIDSSGKIIKRSNARTLYGRKIKPVYFEREE